MQKKFSADCVNSSNFFLHASLTYYVYLQSSTFKSVLLPLFLVWLHAIEKNDIGI